VDVPFWHAPVPSAHQPQPDMPAHTVQVVPVVQSGGGSQSPYRQSPQVPPVGPEYPPRTHVLVV